MGVGTSSAIPQPQQGPFSKANSVLFSGQQQQLNIPHPLRKAMGPASNKTPMTAIRADFTPLFIVINF